MHGVTVNAVMHECRVPPAAATGDASGLAAAVGGDGAEGGISSDEEHLQQDYDLEHKRQ